MESKMEIMVIDDHVHSNLYNKRIISKAFPDAAVRTYSRAYNALDDLNDGYRPQIIFCDTKMPFMSGWEFIHVYDELYNDCIDKALIIMLSEKFDKHDQEKALTTPCIYDLWKKPLTQEKLHHLYALRA